MRVILVKHSQNKIFTYENEEERAKHIIKMEQEGWSNSGKLKQFIGKLLIDSTEDESNYVWIGEFYREEK